MQAGGWDGVYGFGATLKRGRGRELAVGSWQLAVGSGQLAVWLGVIGGGIFFGWVCKERGFLNSFSSGFLSIFSAGFLLLCCNNRSAIGNSASFSEIIRYLV